jgi:uncharacterized protein with NRDE domain
MSRSQAEVPDYVCIIALAHRASTHHPLIVAANRDESHERPTHRAGWWADAPIFGGRDAVAGGTWLGIGRDFRLAAVTNVRDHDVRAAAPAAESRGLLVSRFLSERQSAERFATALPSSAYGPFNLLLFDGADLHYSSNRARPERLGPGVHALSNAVPGEQWPKVDRARDVLEAVLEEPDPTETLFALLRESGPPVGGFDEQQVSLFQRHPVWGTRSSTVILVDNAGHTRFIERSFDDEGALIDEVAVEFSVELGHAPLSGVGTR